MATRDGASAAFRRWSREGDMGGLGPRLLPLPTHSPTGIHGYVAVVLGRASSGGAKGGLGGRVASTAPPTSRCKGGDQIWW
jgi:hypothetical protein